MAKKIILWILGLVLLSSFVYALQPQQNDSLIVWWEFEDGAGTTITDTQGNYSGTTTNDATGIGWSADSKYGTYSYTLNDTLFSYIDTGMSNDDKLSPTNSWTLEFWAKELTSSVNFYFTSQDNGAPVGQRCGLDYYSNPDADTHLQYGYGTCADGFTATEGTQDVTGLNIWQHFTITHAPNGDINMYVNETLDFSATNAWAVTTARTFLFGCRRTLCANADFMRDWRIDDVRIWNYELSSTEVAAYWDEEIVGGGSSYNLINISENSIQPTINNQFNFNNISFNFTGNFTSIAIDNETRNCSLLINDTINTTWVNGNGIGEVSLSGQNRAVVFYTNLTDGIYNYSFNCTDGFGSTYVKGNTFYVDTNSPVIDKMNFINMSIYFHDNITGQWNFTDNLILHSYNISIDGTQIDGKLNLNTKEYAYNLSYSPLKLSAGTHELTVRYADGHTDDILYAPDSYNPKNGIFNDYLKYRFEEPYNKGFVKIEQKDGSWFDTWETEEKVDRYTFIFEPSIKQNSYTFTITSDFKIYEYNIPNSKYERWLVIDEHWLDFYPYKDISIKRISDYEVEVTVNNVGDKIDKIEFNSLGDLNIVEQKYTFSTINISITYAPTVIESESQTMTATIWKPSSFTTNATLIYNESVKASTKLSFANYDTYTSIFNSPDIDTNVMNQSFYWGLNFTNTTDTTNFNTNQTNQTVLGVEIDTCIVYADLLVNFSLEDERTRTPITGVIEVEATINTPSGNSIIFANITNSTSLVMCLPNGTLNAMEAADPKFTIDFIVGYQALSYAQEFWYLDNGTLGNSTYFNAYTGQNITLYDLLLTDSTTFLFTFYDENYLTRPDSIVHTLRKYIGNGTFKEVERSKEDENGETHVHLVEEDVIYYFVISEVGEIIYTSSTYNAKCLSTPCQIELTAEPSYSDYDWDDYDGTTYDIILNKTSRVATLTFVSNATDEINFSLYRYNNNQVALINKSSMTAAGGDIPLTIPNSYGNTTFFVAIHKNEELVESTWVDFRNTGRDYFGNMGAILAGLLLITIALMAVTEGITLIVITCITVLLISVLTIVDLAWVSVISIFCAGGIIIWKLIKLKRGG